MANTVYAPDLQLSSNQADLLRTALASNPRSSPQTSNLPNGTTRHKRDGSLTSPLSNGQFTSPEQDVNGQLTDSPLFDDLDDGNFEWDNGEQLFGEIEYDENGDLHDKRKISVGSEDAEGNKRQEGDSKTPKKPGRKPLTAEPTTKRKAQNRAAQRAFRERKERHLKDLETKVDDLEKTSEATNHENGRLRAQVDKLTSEVKEYRKRLSLNSTANHSPPSVSNQTQYGSNSGDDFSFAFPKFGDLPGSFLTNGSLTKMSGPQQSPPGRTNSEGSTKNLSPSTNSGSFNIPQTASPPAMNTFSGDLNSLTGLFSPQVLASASRSNSAEYFPSSATPSLKNGSTNTANIFPAKPHRASSASMTNSPASSLRFDSSVGTTPEPSGDSPADSTSTRQDPVLKPIKEEGGVSSATKTFSSEEAQRKLSASMASACGCIDNPIPAALSSPSTSTTATGPQDFSGIDFFAQQNGGTFDPVLFGDYRDPQDSVLGGMDDFFTDAFVAGSAQDFSSPYNAGDAVPPSPKAELMASVEKAATGEEGVEVVGAEEAEKRTLGIGEVWDRVEKDPAFKSGETDIDNLCSQFKSKAKCSSRGAVLEEKDVDKILKEKGGTTNTTTSTQEGSA